MKGHRFWSFCRPARLTLAALGLFTLAPAAHAQTILAEDEPREHIVVRQVGPGVRYLQTQGPGPGGRVLIHTADGRGPHRFMLGVFTMPATPALRAHLKLEKELGLVVEHILPESAAEKAGLKVHDVLIKAAGEELRHVPQLYELIAKQKDQPFELELIRAGEKLTLTITPAEAPQDMPGVPAEVAKKIEEMKKRFPVIDSEVQPDGSVMVWSAGPSVVVGEQKSQPLPKGMSVVISKEGDSPAKITVKDGDKTYEATEDKLDSLPKEVRPHVERMMGRMTISFEDAEARFQRFVPQEMRKRFDVLIPRPRVDIKTAEPDAKADDSAAASDIAALKKEVETMRKMLEGLQKRLEEK